MFDPFLGIYFESNFVIFSLLKQAQYIEYEKIYPLSPNSPRIIYLASYRHCPCCRGVHPSWYCDDYRKYLA